MKPFNLFDISFEGIKLVESSAGTGKTYNITGLYVRAIAERGYKPSEILVVTFTKAATQELKDRITHRLRDAIRTLEQPEPPEDDFLAKFHIAFKNDPKALENLKKAWQEIDLASIYTIHGFCQQALQEYIFESNSSFDIEYTGNDTEIKTKAADDIWRGEIHSLENAPEWRKVLIEYLMESIKEPDELKKRLSAASGKPFLTFISDTNETELGNSVHRFMRQFEQAKSKWNRDEVAKAIEVSGLTKRSYKASQVEKMLDDVEKMLNSSRCALNFTEYEEAAKLHSDYYNQKNRLKSGANPPEHPFLTELEKLFDFNTDELAESYLVLLAKQYHEKLNHIKEESRIRSFDDILTGMSTALKDERMLKAMRDSYPLALVDEFQDTDPVQLDIFDSIYNGFKAGGLFLIGDPKQSIYKFRGADIFSYLSVKNRDDVEKYTLEKNFRSAGTLVEGINELFKTNGNPWPGGIDFFDAEANKDDSEFDDRESGSKAPIIFFTNGTDEKANKGMHERVVCNQVASEIVRLLKKSKKGNICIIKDGKSAPLAAGDIAILVQTHYQAESIRKALIRRGVKSVTKSNKSVFQTEECDFLIHLLQVIANPGNLPLMRFLLFSGYVGCPLSQINALEENSDAYSELITTFSSLKNEFAYGGFLPLFTAFLRLQIAWADGKKCDVESRILSMDEAERRYANLMHLAELADEAGRSDRTDIEELRKWFIQMKQENSNEETEIRLESDDNLVHILTIHSSKGLEFPVVFCPFLWASTVKSKINPPLLYHDEQGKAVVNFTGTDHNGAHRRVMDEQKAELIRLTYVALTRAGYRCYINVQSYIPKTKAERGTSPLYFVLSGPDLKSTYATSEDVTPGAILDYATQLAETQPKKFTISNAEINHDTIADDEIPEVHGTALEYGRTDTTRPSWYITSYSGIKKSAMEMGDESLREESKIDPVSEVEEKSKGFDVKDFPKGAAAGVFMHKIFEEIVFSEFDEKGEKLIGRFLEEDGYDVRFSESLSKMTKHVLEMRLPHSNASLMNLEQKHLRKEMEFYFSLKRSEGDNIARIIRGGDVPKSGFNPGYMTGFIDLLFEHEGKFYILDYKSDTCQDYSTDALKSMMRERGYDYQYHIYTLALVRMLKDFYGSCFDYEKMIGGAYYLYLRGIDPQTPGNGIFFDLPKERVVKKLDEYFG